MAVVTESRHLSLPVDSSSAQANQVAIERPMSQVTQVARSDTWFFGTSQFRTDGEGNVRPATAGEIDDESKYHPAAMLQVLAAGAETLRWNPADRYDINDPGDGDPNASGPQSPTEILRYRMRQDIANGRFTIDDSGKIYENTPTGPSRIDVGPPVSIYRENVARLMAPEEVGFELNALLIESLAEKIDKLSDLGSQLAVLDQWVMEQLAESEEDHVPATFDYRTRMYVQGGSFGPAGLQSKDWSDSTRDTAKEANKLWNYSAPPEESPLDKFVKDKFSDLLLNDISGKSVLDKLRQNYEELLEGSGLEAGSFTVSKGNA